ncbi:hypothetical protein THAOC_02808 [Thalassiosira oceanica]|uniref:Uncharacterized protein n=1 Tax=Thalassiosira oceanica TaxID=159749 RepID=K0TQ57_THAOC|nr:hypothetical protein THAOC_02808 [Thalassiosira oceanica]|eukprot:EJK75467.1 hypothetical protein THAOC_02808 [Thalassiosira oceanica]
MINTLPFGNLEDQDADVAQENFVGDSREATGVVGMSVTYCTAVAVALMDGKEDAVDAVELFPFVESSNVSYQALHNGTVDIHAGAKAKSEIPGVTFSTAYFYGNETAEEDLTMYTLATRKDDFKFSSFVNLVVMSTIKADKDGIGREAHRNMPLISVYGSNIGWALKDAISYSGSYSQILSENFPQSMAATGRNCIHKDGPLRHSIPGIRFQNP